MNSLLRFFVKYQFLLLFLALEVVSLWLLSRHSYYQQTKIENFTRTVEGTASASIDRARQYFSLAETNERLLNENLQLRSQITMLQARYESLSAILGDTIVDPHYEYIPARVINNSVNKQHNYFTLNVGESKGIEKEMGIVTSQGVVGVVVGVSRNYSKAISLLNTDLRISARLKESNHFGSLYWDGNNYQRLILDDIPQHVKVTVGDTVVTSGFSSIFPPNVNLGAIESYTSKGANFHTIRVKLFADIKQLYNVWAVKNLRVNERDSLEFIEN
ncbi:MAG: rod shape-determining protein MreC [Bacteroidales bacterium]